MTNPTDVLVRLFSDPRAQERLDAALAERHLIDFIEFTWSTLEPGRSLIRGWAMDAICEHLEAVSSGQIKRLLINVPPGFSKSLSTNVFWPAWIWGPQNKPTMRFIGASYADSLSMRDNRKCRMLVQSEIYQRYWGKRVELVGDQNEKRKFENSKTGWKLATSVGGVGTGERADVFVIDDPHNVKDAESEARRKESLMWFAEVVPTRLNDPEKSAIVVIMQRTHSEDVSGLILEKELGYEHLCLPMEFEPKFRSFTSVRQSWTEPQRVRRIVDAENGFISRYEPDPEGKLLYCQDRRTKEGELLWPERFSAYHLEKELKPQLRSWGGSYAEAGQLQQRPTPRGGGMFHREDFHILDRAPQGGIVVRGWDLAATKDGDGAYTAGVKIRQMPDGRVIVEHVSRRRLSPFEVEQELKFCAELDGEGCVQDIPQDPGQAGKAQKANFARLLAGYDVRFSPETGSKEDRARPFAAQAEAGNLYLVRGSWNAEYIAELSTFPMGKYKDQTDASSRAYSRLVALSRSTGVGVGPKVVG